MTPVLFLSHGSPLLALEPGGWGEALSHFARAQARPQAILAVSAHWETPGPLRLTSASRPGVMHDFSGFPEALYHLDHPCPGSPDLARQVQTRLGEAGLASELDPDRPLDHGAWVPLRFLDPKAEVPTLQLSLPAPRTSQELLAVGRALAPLRHQGVLLLASGGLVHNLRRLDWEGGNTPPEWARAFENWVEIQVGSGSPEGLASGLVAAPHFRDAVPTSEHFDPLWVALGAAGDAPVQPLFEGWQLGALSLRCWWW